MTESEAQAEMQRLFPDAVEVRARRLHSFTMDTMHGVHTYGVSAKLPDGTVVAARENSFDAALSAVKP